MLDDSVSQAVKVLFNYGVLGIVTVALGYGLYRALSEIKNLNSVILELTRTSTVVIEKNTAAMTNAAAASDRAAEAQRDLADALRQYPVRSGGS